MGYNFKPIRPKHPELTQATDRRLLGEIKFHYQIARHLDEQVDTGYRALVKGEYFSIERLDALTRERNEAHEIFRLYLDEALRRREQERLEQQAMPTR